LISNGFANKHVATATIAQQKFNDIFFAIRADML
jgi:hypothetical protein